MSAQTIADAFAPTEALFRERVMQSTWGHLAPIKGKTYQGHIVFAVGCYDPLNPTILEFEFNELEDSPWLFEAVNEFLGRDQSDIGHKRRFPDGSVWRFDGHFRNYRFVGKFRRLATA